MTLSDLLPDYLLPYLPDMPNMPDMDPEALEQLAATASIGLVTVLALACLCAPLLSSLIQMTALIRQKVFMDKCARQISQLSILLALLLLAIFGGGAFWLHQFDPMIYPQPDIFFPLCFPLGLVLYSLPGLISWKSLKQVRVLRIFASVVSALLLLALLVGGYVFIDGIIQGSLIPETLLQAPESTLQSILRDFADSPLQWLLVCYALCTGMALASACAPLWFIARRSKADYGRDYYAYVMRLAAALALGFLLLVILFACGVMALLHFTDLHDLSQSLDLGVLLIGFGLPLCCLLLWGIILKSATPMRHKAGAYFAVLFLLIALCAQFINYINILPEP